MKARLLTNDGLDVEGEFLNLPEKNGSFYMTCRDGSLIISVNSITSCKYEDINNLFKFETANHKYFLVLPNKKEN